MIHANVVDRGARYSRDNIPTNSRPLSQQGATCHLKSNSVVISVVDDSNQVVQVVEPMFYVVRGSSDMALDASAGIGTELVVENSTRRVVKGVVTDILSVGNEWVAYRVCGAMDRTGDRSLVLVPIAYCRLPFHLWLLHFVGASNNVFFEELVGRL